MSDGFNNIENFNGTPEPQLLGRSETDEASYKPKLTTPTEADRMGRRLLHPVIRETLEEYRLDDESETGEANMSESDNVWHDIAEEHAAEMQAKSIRERQVGGDHYKKHDIQPWDVIDSYQLDFYTGNVIKYVLRQKGDRLQDLEKARHCLDKAIEKERSK